MKRFFRRLAISAALLAGAAAARADDLKIALVYGRTGPLEAYAKQTETGLRLGFEYATKGTMEIDGRKIVIITKDDQGKPDLAKSALAEAYEDDGVDIAVGTTSSAAATATALKNVFMLSPLGRSCFMRRPAPNQVQRRNHPARAGASRQDD